jgi:hypothetical protein
LINEIRPELMVEAAGVELVWATNHRDLGPFPVAQHRTIRGNRSIQVRNRYSSSGRRSTSAQSSAVQSAGSLLTQQGHPVTISNDRSNPRGAESA